MVSVGHEYFSPMYNNSLFRTGVTFTALVRDMGGLSVARRIFRVAHGNNDGDMARC